jgi:hypothetical protein
MKLPMEESMRLPIILRRWMIERFIQQKEEENKAVEAQQRKAKNRKR